MPEPRGIDVTPGDDTPEGHYKAAVACENCGFIGEAVLVQTQAVFANKCPQCKCVHTLQAVNHVKIANTEEQLLRTALSSKITLPEFEQIVPEISKRGIKLRKLLGES